MGPAWSSESLHQGGFGNLGIMLGRMACCGGGCGDGSTTWVGARAKSENHFGFWMIFELYLESCVNTCVVLSLVVCE